jgi:hypothetical protein
MAKSNPWIPLVAGLLALAGCGEDSDDGEEAAIARYCESVAAAELQGEQLFSDVDESDTAALADAERAMLAFVHDTFPEADELPSEIRDDFGAFLAGFERRVAEGAAEATADEQAAEERILAWEEEHCGSQ